MEKEFISSFRIKNKSDKRYNNPQSEQFRNARYRLINYVNDNYDIRSLYKEVTGHDAGQGKCFCPMHSNTDTPAAKIYGNSLKCFGECNRSFGPYDFLKRFFPEELKKITETVVLPNSDKKRHKVERVLSRNDIDFSKSLQDILKTIIVKNIPDSDIAQIINTTQYQLALK